MVIMHAVVASILFAWVLPQASGAMKGTGWSPILARYVPCKPPARNSAFEPCRNCRKPQPFHIFHQLQWTSGVWADLGWGRLLFPGWKKWWNPWVLDHGELGCPWVTPLWDSWPCGLDMPQQQDRRGPARPMNLYGPWMWKRCPLCRLNITVISLIYHDISWLPCDSQIMVWLPWEQNTINTLFRSLRFAKV